MLVISHRAGNTLDPLGRTGAPVPDVLEADVHWHHGRLEVRHLKTAGPVPVLWDRWELASAAAPRLLLQDLLRADRRGAALMLDLKGRRVGMAGAVATAVRDVGADGLLVCGRFWPTLDEVARLAGVREVLSARNRLERLRLERRILGHSRPAPYGVALHVSLLRAPLVSRLREEVEVVMTWPVDDPVTLAHVTLMGVNGVISKAPHALGEGVWSTPHTVAPTAGVGRRAG